jgi:Tfp pilus assembly protein PilF
MDLWPMKFLAVPVLLLTVSPLQEQSPMTASDYYNRGVSRIQQNNPVAAASDFDKAIELDPRYAQVYKARGLARATYLGDPISEKLLSGKKRL